MLTVNDDKDLRLSERAQIAIEYAKSNPDKSCIFISIHSNAAGSDGKWKNARGWCVFTSPGKTKSDTLATYLYNEAKAILPPDNKYYVRSDWSDKDPDYEANFYVLTKTKCPAVLTENLFYDNKDDLAFLTSEEGKKKK